MPDEDGDKPAEPASGATATDGGSDTSDGAKASKDVAADADARSGAERSAEAPGAEPPKKKKKKKKAHVESPISQVLFSNFIVQ